MNDYPGHIHDLNSCEMKAWNKLISQTVQEIMWIALFHWEEINDLGKSYWEVWKVEG